MDMRILGKFIKTEDLWNVVDAYFSEGQLLGGKWLMLPH